IEEYVVGKGKKKKKTILTSEQIDKVKQLYFSWQTGIGYKDIPELCKSADISEIKETNYSLIPSRYVEFVDKDLKIDYEKEMTRIQSEMKEIIQIEKESQENLVEAFRGIGYEI